MSLKLKTNVTSRQNDKKRLRFSSTFTTTTTVTPEVVTPAVPIYSRPPKESPIEIISDCSANSLLTLCCEDFQTVDRGAVSYCDLRRCSDGASWPLHRDAKKGRKSAAFVTRIPRDCSPGDYELRISHLGSLCDTRIINIEVVQRALPVSAATLETEPAVMVKNESITRECVEVPKISTPILWLPLVVPIKPEFASVERSYNFKLTKYGQEIPEYDQFQEDWADLAGLELPCQWESDSDWHSESPPCSPSGWSTPPTMHKTERQFNPSSEQDDPWNLRF